MAAEDVVGGFFADHDRGGVEVAVGDPWEDRAVGDPQGIDADHAAFGIDDGAQIVLAAHPAGAAGVIGAFGVIADEVVEVTVEDHGKGFEPTNTGLRAGHLGLEMMRRRVATVHGTLDVKSAPGQGTRVVARLPVTEQGVTP